jgi:hypothetical protein
MGTHCRSRVKITVVRRFIKEELFSPLPSERARLVGFTQEALPVTVSVCKIELLVESGYPLGAKHIL